MIKVHFRLSYSLLFCPRRCNTQTFFVINRYAKPSICIGKLIILAKIIQIYSTTFLGKNGLRFYIYYLRPSCITLVNLWFYLHHSLLFFCFVGLTFSPCGAMGSLQACHGLLPWYRREGHLHHSVHFTALKPLKRARNSPNIHTLLFFFQPESK